jgi:hypothetical protein
MGGGVSRDSQQLAKLEYLVQKKKPVDGSDCVDLESALIEIGKLRTLCRLVEPEIVNELLGEQPKDKSAQNSRELSVKDNNDPDPILTLLQEKLDNRLLSLQEAFRKIDMTGSGYITKEEFIQVHPFLLPSSLIFSSSLTVMLVLGDPT